MMDRLLGGLLAGVFASLLAVVVVVGAAPQAEGASGVKVCGSGYGHGVGLSQYGAKGRAEAGQGHARIIKAYYRDASLQRVSSPAVRVLLEERAAGGKQNVTVRKGRKGTLKNLASGGTVDLDPARYQITYLSKKKLYRVTNVSEGEQLGVYTGPLVFRPAGGGPLGSGPTDYRGALQVRFAGSKLMLINRLGMEGYVRGVVPEEMPSSWAPAALESQAIAARSFAEATRRDGAFDFYDDVRDQVYGGASVEAASTNRAVSATSGKVAMYNGDPITAFFHSSSAGRTESAENVFGNPVPYLKSVRDVDAGGRPYEGRAHAGSPWMRWEGEINTNGSPQLGVGKIENIRVLDRAPSGRVERVRIQGSDGAKTVSGQQDIRFGLKSTGVKLADGSSRPGGALPSARASFGGACN
ncbi:MAG: SpoIID/LytB domain-containing protein [Rubrobacter sp.]|nr:SpoIID/LytB domain-containing protein [Rubrobacter sp.]